MKEVLLEDLRHLCLFKLLKGDYQQKFFDYLRKTLEYERLPSSDNSIVAMKAAGINDETVNKCVE